MSNSGLRVRGDTLRGLPEPSGAFVWRQAPWGAVLACTALEPYASHLFTTRDIAPGVGVGPDEAWSAVAAWLRLDPAVLYGLDQVHGCRVLVTGAAAAAPSSNLPSADAAISNQDADAVVVKTADCVPVLIADRTGRGVAAVHAGWRGTAQGIAAKTVDAMAETFGSHPRDLVAAIGPSIGPCCYEVGPEVRAGFAASSAAPAPWFAQGAGDRSWLDLWRANAEQLADRGVPTAAIHVARLCTACNPGTFFSYRRERARAGRMLAAIRKA